MPTASELCMNEMFESCGWRNNITSAIVFSEEPIRLEMIHARQIMPETCSIFNSNTT